MSIRGLQCFVLAIVLTSSFARADEDPAVEQRGLRCVSRSYFPTPEGTQAIPLPGGDFETEGKLPAGWAIGRGEVVTAPDAPQGKSYCRIPARTGTILLTPRETRGIPGQPHFISFWLNCPEDHWTCIGFTSDEPLRTAGDHYPGIPATDGQWRRVGYYVWMPAQCKTIHLQIQPHKDIPEGQYICVDDVQLRTATEAEMSAAYEAERAHLPPYDASPRPEDGKNLALSVAKWEGRAGIPGRPFVIWAVGSSWTNFQGDGYPLIRAIRQRFPNAPPIIYKKHAGSGTPWDFARGWVEQFVAADQPDLVFTYTNGSPEGLDALLTAVRRLTTADILVPSLHFFERSKLTDEEIERGVVPWEEIRAICRKHKAEFVENRRELAEYMKREGLEPPALVGDAVHQNRHGFVRIWDNITRHIARPAQFNDAPEARERRIRLAPAAATATEQATFSGNWTIADGVVRSGEKGAKITVRYTGNRIDLIGRRLPGGGSVRVLIDGAPGDQAPAFFTTLLKPEPKQWPLKLQGPGPGDIAPHAVQLGRNLVPQTWTITVTSETGDYRLEGSVTGPDGEGNLAEPFVSRSGQVGIDPKLWRHGRTERKGEVVYGNREGDRFTFDVSRAAVGHLSFASPEPSPFVEPLVQNLPNGPHTLELVVEGDGEVVLDSLYVFQPPLADERKAPLH